MGDDLLRHRGYLTPLLVVPVSYSKKGAPAAPPGNLNNWSHCGGGDVVDPGDPQQFVHGHLQQCRQVFVVHDARGDVDQGVLVDLDGGAEQVHGRLVELGEL